MTQHQRKLRAVWAAYTAHPRASYRDIQRLAGISSPSVVQSLVTELACYGYLRYTPGSARSVRVLVPFRVVT